MFRRYLTGGKQHVHGTTHPWISWRNSVRSTGFEEPDHKLHRTQAAGAIEQRALNGCYIKPSPKIDEILAWQIVTHPRRMEQRGFRCGRYFVG